MKLVWVLNKEYEQIGVIDCYGSLIWSTRYNDIGECELYLPCTEENVKLLQKNYYLARDDDDMVCRIEEINLKTDTEDGDYLTIKAYDCRKILNQRIILGTLTFKGTVEDLIRRFVRENISKDAKLENRRINNFVLGERQGFEETFDGQVSWDPLFDKVQELSETYGYGSKVTLKDKTFAFSLYKGVDRSVNQNENDIVVFSEEYENLASSTYNYNGSSYKNCYISAGEGEGEERTLVTQEDENLVGIDRYELFVDANDVSSSVSYEDLLEIFPEHEIRARKIGEEPDIPTETKVTKLKYVMTVDGEIVAFIDEKPTAKRTPSMCILTKESYLKLLEQHGKEQISEYKCSSSFEGEAITHKYREDYNLGDIVTVKNRYGISCDARITEAIESFEDNEEKTVLTFEYQLNDADMGDYILRTNSEILTTEGGIYIEC